MPVAAICGATSGLARAGLLDERRHTSAAPEYLAATGYAGGAHYVDARAVSDGGLVTAGPDAPVQFARATLGLLGLMPEAALDAYEGVFARGDASALPHADGRRRVTTSTHGDPRRASGGPSPQDATEAGTALTDVILATFRLNGAAAWRPLRAWRPRASSRPRGGR